MPAGERPRERLRDQSPQYLSNAELLAILLRTGVASENVVSLATRLLASHGGLGGLARTGFQELCQVRGLGEANLLSAQMTLLDQESLRVLLLNTRNQVMGISEVYRGNVNSAVVRAAEVFREAVRQNCLAVIVVHNHPSGDPTPSDDDVRVTKQLVEAGRLLDIELLDYIVLAQQGFVSLKERGLGF